MGNDRSAISKSMSKKRVSGTHVSGLSTSKAGPKRKEAPVKFGKLSRKQKQDFEEYGELVPQDFEMDQEETTTKRRRVINEADLDRELDEEKKRADGQFDSTDDSDDESEEEDWKKPSAYSLLVGSLKKNSKQKDFYKKIQREQEGIEEVSDSEEELPEDEETGSVDMNEDSIEGEEMSEVDSDEEGEEDDDSVEGDVEVEDKDAADPLEDDEEEEIVYVGSEDEEEVLDDLFDSRFADQLPASFDEKISVVEQKKWVSQNFHDDVLKEVTALTTTADKTISEMPKIESLQDVKVKQRIANCWPTANKDVLKKNKGTFTPLQNSLFSQMNNYRDMVFCNRELSNAKEIRNAYVLHALNHVTKTRDRVLKNNSKLAKAQKEGGDAGEMRDQGFTRPKVLIVLPFRNTVVDVVDTFIKLSGTEQHENKNRLFEQFNLREEEAVDTSKPADYLQNFQGNIDDHFRLGIKFAKKSMKLFSDFYNADVIIASPLGLRTLIGTEGDKKRDFDFLSSIELVIMDQSNHFLMQNWEHIEHIFQHLNLTPKDGHGCDISRIKSWYLDGKAKYLRQTLVFADFLTPEFNALFNKHLKNVSGKLKIKSNFEEGSILDVIPQVQQVKS
ncbi:unnamed protein product [Mucor hiemalis]